MNIAGIIQFFPDYEKILIFVELGEIIYLVGMLAIHWNTAAMKIVNGVSLVCLLCLG